MHIIMGLGNIYPVCNKLLVRTKKKRTNGNVGTSFILWFFPPFFEYLCLPHLGFPISNSSLHMHKQLSGEVNRKMGDGWIVE